MAKTYRQEFLAVMRRNEDAMTTLFADLAARIEPILFRAGTGEHGAIPLSQAQAVRDQIGTLVANTFLVPIGGAGAVGAFEVQNGTVIPRSPYMQALWPNMTAAVENAISEHAAIMRRQLRNAPDVLAALEQARRNPFKAMEVREQESPARRPYLTYDPLHRFVDPRGYTLSTRIWDTSNATRRKLDALLTEQIAEGRGSRYIAREVEQFLLPGRKLIRTRKPYGTDASYDAMRLARTEITAAAGRAGMAAARMNPFVSGLDWVRSSTRRPCTSGICDINEAGSPYTLDNVPQYPAHPHEMCYFKWRTDDDMSDIIADLRDQIRAARTGAPSLVDFVGPLLVARFMRFLIGEPDDMPEYVY